MRAFVHAHTPTHPHPSPYLPTTPPQRERERGGGGGAETETDREKQTYIVGLLGPTFQQKFAFGVEILLTILYLNIDRSKTF